MLLLFGTHAYLVVSPYSPLLLLNNIYDVMVTVSRCIVTVSPSTIGPPNSPLTLHPGNYQPLVYAQQNLPLSSILAFL